MVFGCFGSCGSRDQSTRYHGEIGQRADDQGIESEIIEDAKIRDPCEEILPGDPSESCLLFHSVR